MILILTIKEINVSNEQEKVPSEAWIVVNADESKKPVSTSIFNLKYQNVDSTIKIKISDDVAKEAFVYFTLCFHGSAKSDIIPRTRAKLSNLPLDGYSQFKLQLFNVNNPSSEFASISIIGTISEEKDDTQTIKYQGSNNYIL